MLGRRAAQLPRSVSANPWPAGSQPGSPPSKATPPRFPVDETPAPRSDPCIPSRSPLAMARTARSPCETRAEAISIRFTQSSSSSSRAIDSFSRALNETPEVCSPSRSVVSRIFYRGLHRPEVSCGSSRRRRSRRDSAGSPRRRSRSEAPFLIGVDLERRAAPLDTIVSWLSRSTVNCADGCRDLVEDRTEELFADPASAAGRCSARCCGKMSQKLDYNDPETVVGAAHAACSRELPQPKFRRHEDLPP